MGHAGVLQGSPKVFSETTFFPGKGRLEAEVQMPLFSIRNQLLIFFCLLTLVPVAFLGILVFHRTEAILQQRVSREMRVEVVSAAETLETYLEGVNRDLLFLARFLQRRLSPEMDETRWREVEDEFYLALHAESTYLPGALHRNGRMGKVAHQ